MLFSYTAVANNGVKTKGTLDAPSKEAATSLLQKRGLTVIFIMENGGKSAGFLSSLFKKLTSFIR